MQALIQHHLGRAKNRMKLQADKNRVERFFTVGTWVYVKLQPYVQSSLATRANQKLSYWFFGPYLITEKIGSVAYRLQLPAHSTIHPVFQVSQLKIAVPVPEHVLQKRVAKVGTEVRLQALVKWSGMSATLATWEDMEGLRQRFPRASWCLSGGCQQP
ncbi:uncharacterized protein [Miscanthus floridulus]|uniref:uncharacterized protein n=1 Tax=Miscanthus floridulus TaxID=154761 RepID=UPI003459B28D